MEFTAPIFQRRGAEAYMRLHVIKAAFNLRHNDEVRACLSYFLEVSKKADYLNSFSKSYDGTSLSVKLFCGIQ